eukprot:3351438-Amphidinium_carterae.2
MSVTEKSMFNSVILNGQKKTVTLGVTCQFGMGEFAFFYNSEKYFRHCSADGPRIGGLSKAKTI